MYTVYIHTDVHIWLREDSTEGVATSTMYPSYPAYTRHSKLSIWFAVPNKHIVKVILQHCKDEDNLRLKAAGNTLYPRIWELARIMSCYCIQLTAVKNNKLGVTFFLPLLPCPPP